MPGRGCSVVGSPCQNRSNARAAASAVMPGPSSVTRRWRLPSASPHRRPTHGGAAVGVVAGVGQQVVDHLSQPVGVATHRRRARRPGSTVTSKRDGCGRAGRRRASSTATAGDVDQVDVGLDGRPALVEAGEQQQVVDEHAHAGRLVLDAVHGQRHGVGVAGAAAVAARRSPGSRSAACAARGRRRPRSAGSAPPRRCGRRARLLEAVEHRVERQRQVADLAVGWGTGARSASSPAAMRSAVATIVVDGRQAPPHDHPDDDGDDAGRHARPPRAGSSGPVPRRRRRRRARRRRPRRRRRASRSTSAR